LRRSIRVAVLSAVVAGLLVGTGSAHAASVIGPGGQVSSCYVKKGKAKGTLRVVPPGKRCKKGEKSLTLSAQGQAGQTGQTGQSGTQGGSGQTSSSLETRVANLESILSGITNTDLLNAIGSVARVDSLCAEVPTAVGQLNSIRTVLTGLALTAPCSRSGPWSCPRFRLRFPRTPAPRPPRPRPSRPPARARAAV
jgi:hypothetical protein